jgi:hypothetical protein
MLFDYIAQPDRESDLNTMKAFHLKRAPTNFSSLPPTLLSSGCFGFNPDFNSLTLPYPYSNIPTELVRDCIATIGRSVSATMPNSKSS